ncbi:hypothetical protein EWM64_g9953, partial [Hericium alpestre]
NCSFRGRAGFPSGIYCDNTPSSIQNGGIEFSGSAVVFEIKARIKRELCFFTKDGDRDHPIQYEADRKPPPDFASCWLEAPTSTAEDQAIWSRAMKQLQQIGLRADSTVHMEEFVQPVVAVELLLVDIYITHGTALCSGVARFGRLPVFCATHEHIAIMSQDQIPFDKCVRVRFTLHLTPPCNTSDGRSIIGARMLYMHALD